MAVLERGLGQRHIPERRGGISKIVAAGVLAGAVGLSAFGVYEATQNSNEPGSTPIPGGIIEPSGSPFATPFLTENPTVTISPSPELSPTPTPSVEPTPTPTPTETPVPAIEKVPITWPGYARTENWGYSPGYIFQIDNATIVAKEPLKDGKLLFAITLAPNNKAGKIDVKCTKDKTVTNAIDRCTITGATLWIKTDENTGAADTSFYSSIIGYGPKAFEQYLKVGDKVDNVVILFGRYLYGNTSTKNKQLNLNSLAKLKASDGKKYPRSDRRFTFYTAGIILDTSIK